MRHVRIAIIGAGLAGASTAWHLRQRGVEEVVILERESVPGFHASGRNAAILRERMDDARLQPLAAESTAVLRAGTLAPFRRTGGLLLGLGDDAPVEPVAARVPFCTGNGALQPDDGVVDVAALLTTYLAGTQVHYDTTVQGFEAGEQGVRVETTRGVFHADLLVNAAGAWAGALADLPIEPTNRHLFVTEPDPTIDPDGPYLWDVEAGYYLRPESGGLLLSACDETRASPGETPVDPAIVEALAMKLRTHQPALVDLEIKTGWVGQRTFAADRMPVIGFDARRPRLFHVAGLGGHGVTLSWAVGARAATRLIAGGYFERARFSVSI